MFKSMRFRFAPLALACTLCAAEDVFPKEGLWRIHVQSTIPPGNLAAETSSSVCHSRAFDEAAKKAGHAEKNKICRTIRESVNGLETIHESQCKSGAAEIRIKIVSTRVGDTAVHSEVRTSISGVGQNTETVSVPDLQWAGPCPDGIQPGDTIDKDGKVTHPRWKAVVKDH